ncbi:NADH-quinone oxidoreductase subunit NuoG [Nitrospira moscoviensis]|uniref:NADH-quinone oxidoreductase n=1 Tax=Nitrospira moscoviensis TaxID=42253 RepID=A0A0K2G7Z6_NITMO|nr:NADH-quinone oxidoreductase subunit NuoG [Nitrospira moscoviensis]ALA56974.1 NADH-quinone oxidoreductase, subunit G [Nitrospira moscoviensis]
MPTTETVRLTIDGQTVTVPKGTLVIEAARRVGVMIPHFCYHPKLKPDANCRMCLVEVEKMPKLQTACSTPVAEGMSVRTATTVVNDAHKSVLEFILANHPLDCPVCDQGGRCDLQDFSHQYTATTSRFVETKRIFQKDYFSPLIETQMNRCVQCLRCVRYCDEVMDVKALAPVGRGTMTEIKHFGAHPLDCEFCGGCVQICPVGAITSRLSMYEYRPWMLKRADTVCGYCGDGCQLTVQTKDQQLVEVNSAHGAGRNNGDLCARGFFGFRAGSHPERLTQPLIRRSGALIPATWEEALEFIADKAGAIKSTHGGQSFGGLISGRCTNEDLYLFQKFMRVAIGTNSLDSSARYGHLNGVQAMRRVQGTHRWTVSFDDIAAADVLLLVGTNITETNPITGLKVKEAVKKRGATLVTIEALEPAVDTISNIANLASHHFAVPTTQLRSAVLGLLNAVVEQQLVQPDLAQRHPAFIKRVTEALQAIGWPAVQAATGYDPSAYREAAKLLAGSRRLVILTGQGLLRGKQGYTASVNLLDLLLLIGKLDQPGCGFAPLAEENNDQGAVEMGAAAELLPGPVDVTDRAGRDRVVKLWGGEPPPNGGASLVEMLDRARAGILKAMFVVGENPVASLPAQVRAEESLRTLDLLVCQELFLTETAALAHVVLPAASSMEKSGTFTNTEGHVQAVRPAIDPVGYSRPDWEVFAALSVLLDSPLDYAENKDILKEIRSLIPGYGSLGPAPAPPKIDRAAVDRYLAEGFQTDMAARYAIEAPVSRPDGTVQLELVQSLFHSGKLSTRSTGLLQVEGAPRLRISPRDAARFALADGDRVRLSNTRGEMTTQIKVVGRVPEGQAWFPDHFSQQATQLFDCAIDPVTRVPSYRTTTVSMIKVA